MVSASSGLPVGVSSLTPTVCQVAGLTVTLVGAGSCALLAQQGGDATYLPSAAVTQSFTVAAQTSGGGGDTGDVPLPAWAVALLAAGMARRLAGRRKTGSGARV
jgi:hypothetical protein